MDSLEWINAEIAKWQEILESFKEQLKQVKGTRNEQVTLNHIECYELKLKYLQQIKNKLEAWKVINEEFIIKPYYQVNGKYPAIMIRHRTEDDEFCRRGVSQEKYNIVEKALEVK